MCITVARPCFPTVFALLLLASQTTHAQDFDAWIANLKEHGKMTGGPHDEGKKDNRNSIGTGSVVDWLTYHGDVYVEPTSSNEKYTGHIYIHFTGRERKADYKLGAQTGTNDTQSSGRAVGQYSFGFDGNVSIKGITKEGGLGRVGDAVVRHMDAINGKKVKP